MNECKCGCGKTCQGKGKWYSDAHRKAFVRAKPDNPDTTRTNVRVNPDKPKSDKQVGQPHAVHILTKHDVGLFRGSPAYWLDKDTGLSHLSCDDLKHRLSAMNPWQGSPEYAERVYRLTHGLATNDIPINMIGQDYT